MSQKSGVRYWELVGAEISVTKGSGRASKWSAVMDAIHATLPFVPICPLPSLDQQPMQKPSPSVSLSAGSFCKPWLYLDTIWGRKEKGGTTLLER